MSEQQETLHFLDYWRVIRARKEIVLAVSLLVVLTGLLITYSMPRVYCATAVIKVKEESPDIDPFGERDRITRIDPLFLRTQFEIIQSATVVEDAIRRRDLDKKLSKAYGYDRYPPDKVFEKTVKLLSKSMKVQQYRDTNLIEINIYLSEPKGAAPLEAAETANTVAEVYKDQNMKRSRDAVEKALKALQDSLSEQKQRVADAEKRVEDVRQKHKLDLISPGIGASVGKQGITTLENLRIKAKVDLADKEVRLKTLEDLSPEKRLDAGPKIVGDVALERLVAEKRAREVELDEKSKTLGPKHPTVESLQASVVGLDKKIQDAMGGLMTSLKAEFDSAKATVEVLDKEIEKMKAEERSIESSGYREFDRAQKEFEHAQRIYHALETRYREEDIELRIPRTIVEKIKIAKPPDEEDNVSPNLLLNMVLSIVVGLGAGIGLAYLIEYLDVSVKTIEDIERSMGVPVLGVIPQRMKALSDKGADHMLAEPYRVLRANVRFSNKFTGGKTFCITSGSVGEGKSLTLFNLAYVCAELGDKVVIVDSDMHRPKQHKFLAAPNKIGLANVLVGDVNLEDAILPTNFTNLHILPSGRLSTPVHGLLDTRRTKELVRELGENYDMVFFDTPPIIGVSDASLIVREMDGVVLVIQHRKYPRWVSHRAKKMLDGLGANLIGVVLNNINISRDYSYYYYYHQQYYGAYPAKKAGGND